MSDERFTLDVEDLAVDSFDTLPPPESQEGTVFGHGDTEEFGCPDPTVGSTCYTCSTCDTGCPTVGSTCTCSTCGGHTCGGHTCGGTCAYTCGSTCDSCDTAPCICV